MRERSEPSSDGAKRAGCFSTFGFVILAALAGWIALQHELSPVDYNSTQKVIVTIPSGSGTSEIAAKLVSAGLVRSDTLFEVASRLSGDGNLLKAGTYSFSPSLSAQQIIDKMVAGKTDSDVITVPEGFTASQIADRLAAKKLTDRIAFLKVVATKGNYYSFADGFSPPRDLEGYLYPLTYKILRSSTPREIAGQMLTGFDQNVIARNPDVHDWRPIIVLASLIEREAVLDSDRPIIASVYYNRLRIGMPLQCDATVQYALPAHKSRLMYSDLRIDSAYNTYLHRGLPPGAICSPGYLSIEAAIHPAHTNYYFYVAGPGGAHIFSTTLAQQDKEISELRGNRLQ